MSSNPQGTVARSNLWKAHRAAITIEAGFNVRTDMGDVESLARSIADNGIERPLNVKRDPNAADKFLARDGHRRLAAVDLAISKGWIDAATFEIPMVIGDKNSTLLEDLALMARANDGKPLLPYEQAQLFKRMMDEGMKLADVCKAVGKGSVYVRQHLDLLNADPALQDAVKDGKIGKALALKIGQEQRKGKVTDVKALVEQATKGGMKGKSAVLEKVDAHAARQKAIKIKLKGIKEDLEAREADVKARLGALNKGAGMSRAELKGSVGNDVYEAIRAIGMEAALRAIVRGAEAGAEE